MKLAQIMSRQVDAARHVQRTVKEERIGFLERVPDRIVIQRFLSHQCAAGLVGRGDVRVLQIVFVPPLEGHRGEG